MNVWFTSDTHFFHDNILRLQPRPFRSLLDMHTQLILNWNKQVAPGDVVYHLGDFALSYGRQDFEAISELLRILHGSIHLICGNHDRKEVLRQPRWAWVGDLKYIKVQGQKIMLCHYPMSSWRAMQKGAIHLHGHCHGKHYQLGGRLDVGVDCHDYKPLSFEEVMHRIKIEQ